MRGIVSLLTPRYQLLPEAKAIVGISGSINLLFPEYLVNIFSDDGKDSENDYIENVHWLF